MKKTTDLIIPKPSGKQVEYYYDKFQKVYLNVIRER